jgi:predicted dehydrogenase
MTEIGVGVVGFGYWGPNLARNFSTSTSTRLVGICDADEGRRAAAARMYPAIDVHASLEDLLRCDDLEAVAVATPVSTHVKLAEQVLLAGKHVLVEKPLAESAAQAWSLVDLAADRDLCLMVDHTFLYTGAVRKVKQLIDSGEIGDLLYFDSARVALGLVQSDVDVLWDLAVHDLSILEYLVGRQPSVVSATGARHHPSPQVNTAFLTLGYDDDFIGHVNVNWFSPVKIRRTLVGGSRRMIVMDDLEPSEKVKVYDAGYDGGGQGAPSGAVHRRVGDVWVPLLDGSEALAAEVDAFADYIRGVATPHNDGTSGAYLVEVLEAARTSMEAGGAPVRVSGGRL